MKKPFQIMRREILRLRKAGFDQRDRRWLLTSPKSMKKEEIPKIIGLLKKETNVKAPVRYANMLGELNAKEAIPVLNEFYQTATKYSAIHKPFAQALKKLTGKKPKHWKY